MTKVVINFNRNLATSNTFVPPEGPANPKFIFIGEAPGELEDQYQRPFIGRSGKILRQTIQELGISIDQCYFTNLCPFRPVGNNLTPKMISWYAPQMIKALPSTGKIICLGTKASSQFRTSRFKITHIAGETETLPDHRIVCYTVHPRYILSNPSYGVLFKAHISKFTNPVEFEDIAYKIANQQNLEELNNDVESCNAISFDIETNNLDPFRPQSKILLVGLTLITEENTFHNWAIPVDHKYRTLPTALASRTLDTILTNDKPKIAHNAKFDMLWLKRHLNILVKNLVYDTMIASFLIDENTPNGLKAICEIEFPEYSGYDKTSKNAIAKGTLEEEDLDKTAKYCCTDSLLTAKYYFKSKHILENVKVGKPMWLMNHIYIPATYAFMNMELVGTVIDKDKLNEIEIEIQNEKTQLESSFRDDYRIQQYEKAKTEELLKSYTDAESKPEKAKIARQLEDGRFILNLDSTKQTQDVFFSKDGLNLTPISRSDKTGVPSLGREELEFFNEHGEELSSILLKYRGDSKLISGFMKPIKTSSERWRIENNIIHSNFNLIGARTGRTSSSNPNLQNPARRKNPNIRSIFVSRFPNGRIVKGDYSGAELRVMAIMARDKTMIREFKDGKDLHRAMASAIFNIPEPEVSDEQRQIGKAINFGAIYQQTPYGLAKRQRISVSRAEKMHKIFQDKYDGIMKLSRKLIKCGKENGYVMSMIGRVRHLSTFIPDRDQFFESVCVNTPDQSFTSDILILSVIAMHEWLEQNNMRSVIILVVHDEVDLDCPDDEYETVAKKLKEIMEEVPMQFEPVRTQLPMVSDISVGKSWGETEKVF